MVKKIIVIGLLSLVVPFNSYANDSERIDKLEKEVRETKLRLQKLESLLSNTSKDQKPIISGEGWESLVNWRKLATGMSPSDVKNILGEPLRLNGGPFTFWYYQNNGNVVFHRETLYSWTEPR